MEIFLQNLECIAEHNIRYRNREVTYTLGMNRFGDMTPLNLLLDSTVTKA